MGRKSCVTLGGYNCAFLGYAEAEKYLGGQCIPMRKFKELQITHSFSKDFLSNYYRSKTTRVGDTAKSTRDSAPDLLGPAV